MPRITGQSRNDTSAGGTATAEKAPAKPAKQTKKKVEAAAKKYFDAVAARDPDAMAAMWHDDGVEDLVPIGVFRGPDEVRRFFREMFAAMPDAEMTVERITPDASCAAVQWRMRATFDGGPFLGIEPTGKTIEMRGCDVLEINDGKISRNTAYYDGAAFARGVGLLPPQESGAEKAMFTAFNTATKLRARIRQRRGHQ